MHNFWRLTSLVFIFFATLHSGEARNQARVVGSTAVYTFMTTVSERLGRMKQCATPIVEATGTGGGVKIFCGGPGDDYPDMVNTSRPMTKEEYQFCRQHGIEDVIEFKIGFDGIVVGQHPSNPEVSLNIADLYKALAERVEVNGKWVLNPYKNWKEIDQHLPDHEIIVLGPTSSLATREVFEEKVIRAGCQVSVQLPEQCHRNIREDGPFIEAAEYENVIVQKLSLKRGAIGFVSYGFYHQNPNQIRPIAVNGVRPSLKTISDQSYPLSRPLFVYVKKGQLQKVPGLYALLSELLSENASGEDGYLVDKGLIPLSRPEREAMRMRLQEAMHTKTAG